jgi:hypothetical protein
MTQGTSNPIIPVTGPLTNAELRASSVLVNLDGTLLGPLGDLITAELTPVVQLDFVYGINTQTGISAVVTTGVVDTNASRLRLQSGAGAAGSALFTSRRPIKYRPGQGIVLRFTAAFTTGVTNSTQIIGAGTAVDGYFFGFNGATFGLLQRNNSVNTWIAQTAWNGDKCDGTGASGFNWNKTFGNVCQIKYPFLGFGNITFWVQDSATTRWILCHTIQYTNSTATTQATNPNKPFYAQSINSGNTSNLIVYCGSFSAFLAGERSFISSPKWASDSAKNTVTTETCLINLRNATTFNGVTNTALLRLNCVSFISASAAKTASNCVMRFKIGATIGGAPAYATINGTTADNGVTITAGNSCASVDKVGTTVAAGTYIFNMSVPDSGSGLIDLTPFHIFVAPSETLTISGSATSSATVGVSVNWTEDI